MRSSFYFTTDDNPAQVEPFMRCAACNANVCTVEEGDTLDALEGVAQQHEAECSGAPPAAVNTIA